MQWIELWWFCLHMSEKCSTFVGEMRISIAHILRQKVEQLLK